MRNMNCRNVRREIEAAGPGRLLSAATMSHLDNCPGCETLARQQTNLQAIVSSLGTVEAPADFDFRLRARLAAEKRDGSRSLLLGNLSFGFRSAAVAAMLLLIASALVFVNFRTRPNNAVAGRKELAPKPVNATPVPGSDAVAVVPKKSEPTPIAANLNPTKNTPKVPGVRKDVATHRSGNRVGTLEEALTGAKKLTREDQLAESYPSAAFPINASNQSLKVSVDDRRGAVRTISLPSVSFGSQRTLSQNSSPLLASSRGDW